MAGANPVDGLRQSPDKTVQRATHVCMRTEQRRTFLATDTWAELKA